MLTSILQQKPITVNGGPDRADPIIRALKARRSGSCWMAQCPAHEDRNPSLSIREAGGKVLLYCHAGCSQRQVVESQRCRRLPCSPPQR